MLVITRKSGESILIGDDIRIVIVKTGPAVRIGVEAPRDVSIVREELIQKGKENHGPEQPQGA